MATTNTDAILRDYFQRQRDTAVAEQQAAEKALVALGTTSPPNPDPEPDPRPQPPNTVPNNSGGWNAAPCPPGESRPLIDVNDETRGYGDCRPDPHPMPPPQSGEIRILSVQPDLLGARSVLVTVDPATLPPGTKDIRICPVEGHGEHAEHPAGGHEDCKYMGEVLPSDPADYPWRVQWNRFPDGKHFHGAIEACDRLGPFVPPFSTAHGPLNGHGPADSVPVVLARSAPVTLTPAPYTPPAGAFYENWLNMPPLVKVEGADPGPFKRDAYERFDAGDRLTVELLAHDPARRKVFLHDDHLMTVLSCGPLHQTNAFALIRFPRARFVFNGHLEVMFQVDSRFTGRRGVDIIIHAEDDEIVDPAETIWGRPITRSGTYILYRLKDGSGGRIVQAWEAVTREEKDPKTGKTEKITSVEKTVEMSFANTWDTGMMRGGPWDNTPGFGANGTARDIDVTHTHRLALVPGAYHAEEYDGGGTLIDKLTKDPMPIGRDWPLIGKAVKVVLAQWAYHLNHVDTYDPGQGEYWLLHERAHLLDERHWKCVQIRTEF